jgi:competence protein ComEA
VHSPGIYTLPPGARVEDALTAAGGPAPDADLTQVNLVKLLADGEALRIPQTGQAAPPTEKKSQEIPADASQRININTASADQLQELPGIGETRANAIIAYRQEHGPFQSVEDLQQVSGIGPETFQQIQDKITVE